MKNRMYESKPPNGKFFCWHEWEVCEEVGRNWDLTMGVKLLCKCLKCDKRKYVSNVCIKEVPDHLVMNWIEYH